MEPTKQPQKKLSLGSMLREGIKYGAYAILIVETLQFVADKMDALEQAREKKTQTNGND